MNRIAPLLLLTLSALDAAAALLEEVVVTAARSEQRVADVQMNITVVPGDELIIIGHTHLNEAMNRVSGAWVSRGNGQESLVALRSPVLTGAGACGAFLTLEDGIPLRASGFCNVNELFDANSEQASGIEVVKGPASVVYGSNAMHGMINVRTPSPAPVHRVSLEGGPHQYVRGKISVGNDAWRVDANGTSDAGYKDDSGFGQQKVTVKHQGILGDWALTGALTATNLNQETAGFIVGPEVYKDPVARRANPNPEAYRDTRAIRSYARLEKDLAGTGKIVVTPYARYNEMNFIQHFLPGQAIEENGHRSIGVQSGWYLENWTLGIDAELTRGYLKESQPNPTVGSAFLAGTIPPGKHYDYSVDATTIAIFAEHRRALGEDTELAFGARAERVGYDYDNRMLSGRTRDDGIPCGFGGCRFNRPADRTDAFTNLSPRIGVTHALTPNSQFYGFLSRGFRAPQATELYRLQGGQDVTAIDAELLDSLEIGLRGGDDVTRYDVSVYTMRKDNYIFRDSNRSNVDNGKTTHQGIEIALSRALTDALRASINWAYARHRFANNPDLASTNIEGNDIDSAPRQMGSASLRYQPGAGVTVELEWTHLGRYFEDNENLHAYPGHDLLHLRVQVPLNDNLSGFARITNLTDTRYAERADFAFGNDRYFVGEPRSIYVGLVANF